MKHDAQEDAIGSISVDDLTARGKQNPLARRARRDLSLIGMAGLLAVALSNAFSLGDVVQDFVRRYDKAFQPDEMLLAVFVCACGFAVFSFRRWRDLERAASALAASEAQYRLLFDSSPHPMYVFDAETAAFMAVNDAAVTHYGYSRDELLRMTADDLRAGAPRASAESPGLVEQRTKDGTLRQMEIAASAIRLRGRAAWLVLALDVTARRSLEAQLLQSQKMDSVGRLASGVAHDFNNILGVITGYGELLRRRVSGDPKLAKYAEDIVKAADRAAGLTRQLLAFSRKEMLQPRVLDVNVVVAEMERMLRRLIGEDVQLVTVFADDVGRVTADPGQMEQVLMNLAVNARDAMAEGGRIIIETGNAVLTETDAREHPGAVPGRYVLLSVSDTGAGMTAEVQASMFEPFFTTKEAGKGTGLGLATVQGIVKQAGGQVWCDSAPGRGTTFDVYLPRTDAAREAAPSDEAPELPRGAETVLLVEDEQSLREIVRECLEATGYEVLDARHGTAALELCDSHPGTIHLLVTDVVMPGLGGRKLAEQMQERRPEMAILYMSGYTDDTVVRQGVLAADKNFLQKPFTAEALARTVRQVLDGAAAARRSAA